MEVCPLQTALCCSLAERRAAGVPLPEIRTFKLGLKRWSYSPVELVLRQAGSGGGRRSEVESAAVVARALPQPRSSDKDGEDAAPMVYIAQLTNGHELQLRVFLCHGEPLRQPPAAGGDCSGPAPASEPAAAAGDPPSGDGSGHTWRLVMRAQCSKGCSGPTLRPIQRFGRLGKRAAGGLPNSSAGSGASEPSNMRDPRHLWLSLDEACSHVGVSTFRLVAGVYAASGEQLLGTAVSPPIRAIANNDMPGGTSVIPLEAELPADWEGWQPTRAGGAAVAAGATAAAGVAGRSPESSRKRSKPAPAPAVAPAAAGPAAAATATATAAAAGAAPAGDRQDWKQPGGQHMQLQHAPSLESVSQLPPSAAMALASAATAVLAAAQQAPAPAALAAQHAQLSHRQLSGAVQELVRLDSLLRAASSLSEPLSGAQLPGTQAQLAAPAAATSAVGGHGASQPQGSQTTAVTAAAAAATAAAAAALAPQASLEHASSGTGPGLEASLLATLLALPGQAAAPLPMPLPGQAAAPLSMPLPPSLLLVPPQSAFPAAAAALAPAQAAAPAEPPGQPEFYLLCALRRALQAAQGGTGWPGQQQQQWQQQ